MTFCDKYFNIPSGHQQMKREFLEKKETITEGLGEDAARAEMDHEVQMARADCFYAAKDAIELHRILSGISEAEGLEGWVASKITLASDYLRAVKDHLAYKTMTDQVADEMVAETDPEIEFIEEDSGATTSGAFATSMGDGNGFKNGGPGTLKRFKKKDVSEAAPAAVRAAGGAAGAALSGVGGALIGQMFAPFLGATAGGIAGAIGGYKAGAGATDALWDKVSSMFGGEKNAEAAAAAHAHAAAAGEKSFNFGGKQYPVTLKPQDAQKLTEALPSVGGDDEDEKTVVDALKKSGNTVLANKLKTGTSFNKDELKAIIAAKG